MIKFGTWVHFKLTEETITELLKIHRFWWCEAYDGKPEELELLNIWFGRALCERVYITSYETLNCLKDGDDVSADISSRMKKGILDIFYFP